MGGGIFLQGIMFWYGRIVMQKTVYHMDCDDSAPESFNERFHNAFWDV